MHYLELRKKFPKFVFERFSYYHKNNNLVINYYYSIEPGIKFVHETIVRKVSEKIYNSLDKASLDNIIFHIGLVWSLSYWKSTCSGKFVIKAGGLTKDQLSWFYDLLIKGMGQYYYENKINFTDTGFVHVSSIKHAGHKPKLIRASERKVLVPVGGGKDSAVTLATLAKALKKSSLGTFVMLPASPATRELVDISKIDNSFDVFNRIDKNLLVLNKTGHLNGHTPFTALLYFTSLLVAYIYGYKYVAFSNEKSSDEENTKYLGGKINHQYSKTYEFENKFREYNKKYISDIQVFSFLRPLYDLQISRLFSNFSGYQMAIRSCNVSQKEGVWCGMCPKCLSTFLLLFPFLGKSKTEALFGENLFENSSLAPILDSLVDENQVKPFECVGTRAEVLAALYLSLHKLKINELPALIDYARKKYIKDDKEIEKMARQILENWDANNNLPSKFTTILKSAYENS